MFGSFFVLNRCSKFVVRGAAFEVNIPHVQARVLHRELGPYAQPLAFSGIAALAAAQPQRGNQSPRGAGVRASTAHNLHTQQSSGEPGSAAPLPRASTLHGTTMGVASPPAGGLPPVRVGALLGTTAATATATATRTPTTGAVAVAVAPSAVTPSIPSPPSPAAALMSRAVEEATPRGPRNAAFYQSLFDPSRAEVFKLLESDSFARYTQSVLFEELVRAVNYAAALAEADEGSVSVAAGGDAAGEKARLKPTPTTGARTVTDDGNRSKPAARRVSAIDPGARALLATPSGSSPTPGAHSGDVMLSPLSRVANSERGAAYYARAQTGAAYFGLAAPSPIHLNDRDNPLISAVRERQPTASSFPVVLTPSRTITSTALPASTSPSAKRTLDKPEK
jgi:hypothetical protein